MYTQDREYAISVENLDKRFGSFTALNKLNLNVKTGEVHGFLGPNGAGKSTTIRILLGLLRKSGGQAVVLGGDPWKDSVELHKRLTYVPGDVNLWPNLSGGECIDLLGSLRGKMDNKRREELLKRLELDATKKFRTYSKGNRQKVALVAALAADVKLYILDEPTSGLDPLMESVFQDCIKELKVAGKTILLSSHILAEVEALCDRVTIIRQGEAVETGTLSELQRLHRTTVIVETECPITGLQQLKGVHDLEVKDRQARFEVETESLDAALDILAKLNVRSLTSHPPTLEELFLRYYNEQPTKQAETAK